MSGINECYDYKKIDAYLSAVMIAKACPLVRQSLNYLGDTPIVREIVDLLGIEAGVSLIRQFTAFMEALTGNTDMKLNATNTETIFVAIQLAKRQILLEDGSSEALLLLSSTKSLTLNSTGTGAAFEA